MRFVHRLPETARSTVIGDTVGGDFVSSGIRVRYSRRSVDGGGPAHMESAVKEAGLPCVDEIVERIPVRDCPVNVSGDKAP